MRKATGLDTVSARLLRECFDLISDSLALIFNRSIETSIFPDEWKSARITPLYKKCGNRRDPSNYRPISITREVMLDKLKEDTHPQVRANLQRGLLKCKCGFTPKMNFSRTTQNYNQVFLSCGMFRSGQPCGYFQWLHGPLWCPREQAKSSLKRWVHGHVPVPLLKKHCLDTGKEHIDGLIPRQWLHGEAPSFVSEHQLAEAQRREREKQWLNQFAEVTKAQDREFERRRHE